MKSLLLSFALVAFCSSVFAQGTPSDIRTARTQVAGADVPTGYPDFSWLSRGVLGPDGKVLLYGATAAPTIAPNSPAISIYPSYLFNDVTVQPPANGGNLGVTNSISAVLNVTLVPFATMTNGTATAKTRTLMDDTPAAEFSAVTVGVAPTDTQDATIARKGTNSLKLAWPATSVAGDGVQWTAFSAEDWTTEESVGFWVMTSEPMAAGDLTFVIVDSTANHAFNIPAITVANKWTWVEVDISVLATTDGDAVTNYKILLSTAGAVNHAAFNTWFDGGWKWDATEELALGVDVIDGPGAVRNVLTFQKAASGNSDATALVPVALVEDTDFFIARRSGNDFLVTITDQSLRTGIALVCYK